MNKSSNLQIYLQSLKNVFKRLIPMEKALSVDSPIEKPNNR